MSHVEEGLLHAYLDGAFRPADAEHHAIEAHLARCGDCRERLEQARAVRDAARAMLRGAAPEAIPVPDFAAVVMRSRTAIAAAARPDAAESAVAPLGGRRAPRRAVPLAWAASLLLALGAGWIARSAMPGSVDTVMSAELPAPDAPPEPRAEALQQDVRVAATDAPPAADAPAAKADAAPAEPLPTRPAETAQLAAAPVAEGRQAVADAQPVPSIPVTQIPEARIEAPPAAEHLSLPVAQRIVSGAATAADSAAVPVSSILMHRQTGAVALAAAPPAAPVTEPVLDRTARLASDSARAGPPMHALVEQRSGGGGVGGMLRSLIGGSVAAGAAPGGSVRGSPVSPRDAERRAGAPLRHVAGLEVAGHWAWQDAGTWFVRTVQRLEDGGELHVEQWREPGLEWERIDAVLSSGPAADGRHRLLLARSGGIRIALVAGLDRAAVEALVERLEPLDAARAR
jgi:hypothetical protein